MLYFTCADVAQWQSIAFVKRLLEVRFLSSAFCRVTKRLKQHEKRLETFFYRRKHVVCSNDVATPLFPLFFRILTFLFILEREIQLVHCFFLHTREDMRIHIDRNIHIAMPQYLLHNFWMNPFS